MGSFSNRSAILKMGFSVLGDPLVVFVLTVLSAICALILVAPTIPDDSTTSNTRLPSYLHMTTNSKVIASYILGKERFFGYN